MITSSPTFCSAPWTSLNIDQTGRVTPCMHCFDPSLGSLKNNSIQEVIFGKKFQELKETMARGEWHKVCNWCQRLEETTGVSGRTQRQVSKETLDAIDADFNYFNLEHLVINWSNLCNLTCTYCNPATSTAWQSALKIPIQHYKNEHEDLIELAKTNGHSVQGLTLGGGEPLLQKGLAEFLSYLDPQKVNVTVTTNLSVDLANNSVYQILKHWPSVSWMISFDNAEPAKFEYVRNGADWNQFYTNIQTMKADRQHVIAHPAYSIYCALDLESYYEFCVAENLHLYWCELNNPEELDIRRASMTIRQQAIDAIDRVLLKYQGQYNISLEVLEKYKNTLKDNSYLQPVNRDLDIVKWHQDIENKLKKQIKFEDLWPEIVG